MVDGKHVSGELDGCVREANLDFGWEFVGATVGRDAASDLSTLITNRSALVNGQANILGT